MTTSLPRRTRAGTIALTVALTFALAFAVTCTLAACMESRYVIQAGFGQLELWGNAEPIDDVLADPDADPRTRVLLQEVGHVLTFAAAQGMDTKGNYRRFVDLDRRAVVWFMAASEPLAFEAKVWNFPIVGSFPYLGWFSEHEARKIAARLRRDGWDVYIRPVAAYSTGGWFRDPVLSTMFSSRDDAFRTLANVLLHELTHANLLVADQATFNESVASFVGDTMAEQYLIERFGPDSQEVAAYRQELADQRRYGARLAATYQTLNQLYQSDASDADKRAQKQALLTAVDNELGMRYRPNNASLVGFKTYNAGLDELAQLYGTCERSWTRFFAAIEGLEASWFSQPQQEDIGPVVLRLVEAGCPAPKTS
ncbi:aminopeptidase [Haliangium sp.]|uniref:aminopeptidase n=1 Tax=Haliangium sp. TaxID=2663208 RepID=UPI003D0BFD95